VIDGEVAYEALSGRIPADVPRLMCWACLLSGAAGHTYGANGIWQLNRKDQPYGNSPWGGNYGPIPWDEAMRLPGSAQGGYAAKLLRKLGAEKFDPHPEWASFKAEKAGADKFLVPYAAGIAKDVRVIYVPTRDAMVVHGLEAGVRYRMSRLDPVTGKDAEAGELEGDAAGVREVSAPEGSDHDWVVVLDARRRPVPNPPSSPPGD
jgi:hypothetical protein